LKAIRNLKTESTIEVQGILHILHCAAIHYCKSTPVHWSQRSNWSNIDFSQAAKL